MYFCTLDCNYKVAPALALGKSSICNICGEVFILNEYSIRLSKPHCEACHKPKNNYSPVGLEQLKRSEIAEFKIPVGHTGSLSERMKALSSPIPNTEEEEEI